MQNNSNRKRDLKQFHENFVMNCNDTRKNNRGYVGNDRFTDNDRRKSEGGQNQSNRNYSRRSYNKA